MNNVVRIMVAGGIATLLQRSIGLNPLSFEGFAFFMVIFVVISLIWQYFSPQKKEKTVPTPQQIEQASIQKKQNNKKLLATLKKVILLLLGILLFNASINFLSFKFGAFDDEFRYRFATSKAVTLSLKTEPLATFQKGTLHYFLYKHNEKFYLVAQNNKEPKARLLTLYSQIYMFDVYNFLKDEKNFATILKNLSPTVYREVSLAQMLYKPLWLSNSIKDIYWLSSEYEEYKNKYEAYIQKKRFEDKKGAYSKLINQDIQSLSVAALEDTIKQIYPFYAYTQDTRYIISLFDAYDKKSQQENNDIKKYKIELINFLYLFRTKEKLNEILKKYNMGVVYTFNFWDNQPLDIPKQEHSLLRLVSLKDNTRTLLWQDNIEQIQVENAQLHIIFKDKSSKSYDMFDTSDISEIKLKLNALIQTIYRIERNFYSKQ